MRSRIFPLFIIGSLLTIGLFGVLGINMTDDDNGQHSCPVSVLSSGDCSSSYSPLSEAFHHISALQNFAEGVVSTNTPSLILLVLLVFALAVFSVFPQKTPSLQISSYRRHHGIGESDNPQKNPFLHWLAIRYKRNPRALQWVHDYS